MTDTQFQELLQHIDRLGHDVFISALVATIALYIAITIHGITRK